MRCVWLIFIEWVLSNRFTFRGDKTDISLMTNFLAPSILVINEMSVFSPLNVKRFDKTHSIYINHTHLIHFFYTFQFASYSLWNQKFFFSQTENLEPLNLHQSSSMASSSSKQTSGSRSSIVKPKTMAIPSKSFEVQSESPVDFASLKRNMMNLESLITV